MDKLTKSAVQRLENDAILPFKNIHPALLTIIHADEDAHKEDYLYLLRMRNLAEKYGATLIDKRCENELDVANEISRARQDRDINGIILLSDFGKITPQLNNMIPRRLDIDALSSSSIGYLYTSTDPLSYRSAPCTAIAAYKLLLEYSTKNDMKIAGKKVAVIGRSIKVGKPLAELLTKSDMTVTLMHTKTKQPLNLQDYDIVFSAIGQPYHFTRNDIPDPSNSILIDIGINSLDGKIVGDFKTGDFNDAKYISPVPGGVGVLTTTCLFAKLFANKRMLLGSDFS